MASANFKLTSESTSAPSTGALATTPGDAVPWDWLWVKDGGLKPGQLFDIAGVHPTFLALIQSGTLPPGRALVPGCGRGYDVGALASPTRTVVGLETSPGAQAAALAFLAEKHGDAFAAGWATVVAEDFFAHAPAIPYDLIYDYTFLCALLPSRRAEWASKMAELTRPGALLVTLQFPIGGTFPPGKPVESPLPPFALSKSLYAELLGPNFELVSVEDVAASTSGPRAGLEAIALWKRRLSVAH